MYYIKRLQGRFATDTLFAYMKLLHGNTCCQVYSHKSGFTACSSQLNEKGDSLGELIEDFLHEFGAPEHLTFNEFGSQFSKSTRFYKNMRKYSIKHHVSAPRRPNKNPDEGVIREIKRRFYKIKGIKRV